MKKIVFLFILIVVIISIVWLNYTNYKFEYNQIKKYNMEYEKYYNKEITGIELTTIINKAIDTNTKNKVEKNSNEKFIDNEENSIKIDIKISDDDKIYAMETFYNNKIEKFVQYYGTIKFKCTNIEYHKKTNRVKYLYFEQISQ